MQFNLSKSEVMVFFSSKPAKARRKQLRFSIGGGALRVVTELKYLGIRISDRGDLSSGQGHRGYKCFLARTLERAEVRIARVRGFGFHQDSLLHATAVRLYKALVRPILEFATQVVSFSKSQVSDLERFQCRALRSLVGLPQTTL